MKKYPKMKDSGVSWIGEVPERWGVKKLKRIVMLSSEKTAIQKSPYIGMENIVSWNGTYEMDTQITPESNCSVFHKGDILFGKLRPYLAKCVLIDFDGVCSGELLVFTNIKCNKTFLRYFLLNKYFIDIVNSSTYGAKMPRANWDFIGNQVVALPPLPEQDRIVRFLDWKTSEINRLISLRKKQIGGLEELKKAVISKAVTKGLDPNVKMKDSGVSWIGEVPEGWGVKKLKRIVMLSSEKTAIQKSPYIGMENIVSWNGTYEMDTQITPESNCSVFHKGDILFGKLRPYLAKCVLIDFDGVCSGELLVFTNIKCNKTFLRYFLLNKYFIDIVNSSTYGAKMPRANWDFIGNQVVALPPLSEQERIVAYLNEKTAKIDEMIDKKKQQIELLGELKTRLISDVVTGKIDVRDVEIPEYEVTEEEPDIGIDEENGEGSEEQED